MSALTGNKDTDILILMRLSDMDLISACSTNKYVKTLCDDQVFWCNRIFNVFNIAYIEILELKKYLVFEDFKTLYIWLRNTLYIKNILGNLQRKNLIDNKLKNIKFPYGTDKNEGIKLIKRYCITELPVNSEIDSLNIKFIVRHIFNRIVEDINNSI